MHSNIGDLGEADFDRLCTSANLVATRPKKDQYGWDYLVEFPPEIIPSLALDSQPSPIKCMVQVKSTKKHTGNFQVKLSAMLELTRAQMPSFVCFILYDKNDVLKDIYLVHIDKEIIANVLKSVRKNELQNKPLHKVKITIHYKEKDKLKSIKGQCLKDTIKSYASVGMNEYIKQKNELINSIGFDDSSFSITMSFKDVTHNDLIDMSLGLKKDISVEVSKMVQKRFGMEMPIANKIDEASDVKVSINPEPKKVILFIKQSKYAKPIEFNMDLFLSPFNYKEKSKILLKNDIFELWLDFLNDDHKFQFKFEPEKQYLLSDIFNTGKLVDIANRDKVFFMSIKEDDFPDDDISFLLGDIGENSLLPILDIANKLIEIYAKLELNNNVNITLQELWNNNSRINAIYQLLYDDIAGMTTEFSANKEIDTRGLNLEKAIAILPFSLIIDNKIMGAFVVLVCNVEGLKTFTYKLIPFDREIRDTFVVAYKNFDSSFYDETYQNISDDFKEQDIHIVMTTRQYITEREQITNG